MQAPVPAFGVVGVDGALDGLLRGEEGRKYRVQVELVLQNAVDAFRERVLVAVVAIGHAREDVSSREGGQVVVTAVLTAAVGVVQEAGDVPEGGFGLREREQRGVVRQIATQVPADDVATVYVGQQEEIAKAVRGEPDVGDVADHRLPWRRDGGVLEMIRGYRIPVLRVRGAGAAPLAAHQRVFVAEHREQLIAPHAHALVGQVLLELARAHARLVGPHGRDGRHHRRPRRFRRAGAGASEAFVVGVARALEEGADGGDGESLAFGGVRTTGADDGVPKLFFRSVL